MGSQAGEDGSALIQALQDAEAYTLLEALKVVLEERADVLQEIVEWAVPSRAMVTTRLFTEQRMQGVVKSFVHTNGYGFIACDETMEAFGVDVFVHGSQLMLGDKQFDVGSPVSFVILLNKDKKPQAFDVQGPEGKGGKGSYGSAKGSDAGVAGKGGAIASAAPPTKGAKGAKGAAKGAWDVGYDFDGYAAWADGGYWMPMCGPYGAFKGPAKGGMALAAPTVGKGCAGRAPAGKAAGKGLGKSAAAPVAAVAAAPKVFDREYQPDAPPTSMEVPGVTDRRFEGNIKRISVDRGYGFIECPELAEQFGADTFCHIKQMENFLNRARPVALVGQAVTFAVFLNKDQKPQAKDLELIGM